MSLPFLSHGESIISSNNMLILQSNLERCISIRFRIGVYWSKVRFRRPPKTSWLAQPCDSFPPRPAFINTSKTHLFPLIVSSALVAKPSFLMVHRLHFLNIILIKLLVIKVTFHPIAGRRFAWLQKALQCTCSSVYA